MRVSVLDRILLFFTMIGVLVLGISLVLLGTNIITIQMISNYINQYIRNPLGIIVSIVIACAIILLAIRFLYLCFVGDNNNINIAKEVDEKIVLKSSDEGKIMISCDVIRNMCEKKSKSYDGVKDVDCKIISKEDGLDVMLKVFFRKETVIKDVMPVIQTELKEYVQNLAGVNILSIDICADINSTIVERLK